LHVSYVNSLWSLHVTDASKAALKDMAVDKPCTIH